MVLLYGPFKGQLAHNPQVAGILVEMLHRPDLYMASLGLNGIFEVYSENDYDSVFESSGLPSLLQTVLLHYKE